MKFAFELSITSELHKDNFVQQKPHEVKRFGNMAGIIAGVGHR